MSFLSRLVDPLCAKAGNTEELLVIFLVTLALRTVAVAELSPCRLSVWRAPYQHIHVPLEFTEILTLCNPYIHIITRTLLDWVHEHHQIRCCLNTPRHAQNGHEELCKPSNAAVTLLEAELQDLGSCPFQQKDVGVVWWLSLSP